jgi:hypothetical protein
VQQKYFLSPRACAGILRRAARRSKRLPRHLQDALQVVAVLMSQDAEEKMTST